MNQGSPQQNYGTRERREGDYHGDDDRYRFGKKKKHGFLGDLFDFD